MLIVIFQDLRYAAHRARLAGILDALTRAPNCDTSIISSEEGLDSVLSKNNPKIGGIITEVPTDPNIRQHLCRTDIPLVTLGQSLPERRFSCASVLSDFKGEGKLMAEHFLYLGHFASFAYIPHGIETPWSLERGAAFSHTLRKSGFSCSHYRGSPTNDFELSVFLKQLPKPTAVFAANDERAATVMSKAKLAGLRIPEEMSLAGVDDDELICDSLRPPLTSVRIDSHRVGFEAAIYLMKMMRQPRPKPNKIIKIPALGITIRESSQVVDPSARLIERAMGYIRRSLHENITPNDVANFLGVSRALLYLRFRQHVGKSPAIILKEVRIAEAKRLLKVTKRKINVIFKHVGFQNIISANRLFKKVTGMTASEYRRSAKTAGSKAAN